MARVTIQDCLLHIPDGFTLALVAAKRARQLARGADVKLSVGDHKFTVLALQEIAAGLISADILKEPDLPLAPKPSLELESLLL